MLKFKNFASGTLVAGISAPSTSIVLSAGDGAKFPEISGGDTFSCVLTNGTQWEEVLVTSVAGDTFTVTRAADGVAQAWPSGTAVELRVTRVLLESMAQSATLGNAATRNVGTTAGTVAAGDDPRLSDERVPTASGIAGKTHAATSKATPVDADELPLADSASSWSLARLTWANIKATLKTYFDTLYQAASANLSAWAALTTSAKQDALVSGTNIKTVNGASLLGSGDVTVSAAPAGTSGQLQYNNAGAFGGAPQRVTNANTLEQYNGTTAQAQYLYNTRTDASNYERGFMRWNSNVLEIGAEAAGTGVARDVKINAATGKGVSIGVGSIWDALVVNNDRVQIKTSAFFGFSDIRIYRADAGVLNLGGTSASTGSALQLQEITAPAAPAANGVRIYAEDDGSGKTRLMARFATGAAVQIAIEP